MYTISAHERPDIVHIVAVKAGDWPLDGPFALRDTACLKQVEGPWYELTGWAELTCGQCKRSAQGQRALREFSQQTAPAR